MTTFQTAPALGTEARRVWRMPKAGSIARLRLEQEALPAPGPGEVRVAVRAAGLNLADAFACLGLYSATPRGPFVPGLEVAGVVDRVGPAPGGEAGGPAAAPRPGDRVVALTRFGGYATALNAGVGYVRPIPDAWSFAEAAAFPVQALTAWHAIEDLGRVRSGELVLVHSAAGGVGLNALALLRARGARVVGTVGHPSKQRLLAERGLLASEHVIVRTRSDFPAALDRALAARGDSGFDVVLDGVAGPFFLPAFERLRPGGRMVLFGASDLMPAGDRPNLLRLVPRYLRRPRIDPQRMISRNRTISGFNLIWLWDRLEQLGGMYERAASVLTEPPLVGRTYPFEQAPDALRYLKTGASAGKVVLEVS